ncbi:S8 family serine peptidase, partial [Arthrobacter rhizosphaerae]|uniref:S8 family serine peptidase n=1 Tax=Arthrobacter rhizosphaerae TaxID=2855490 RepID=UPI001FF6BB45
MENEQTPANSNYSYVDTSTGRQVTFTPKADEAMITFQDRPTSDAVRDIVRDTPVLSLSEGMDLERGFAAVYLTPGEDMAAAARSLEARPEVSGSLPVMIDENGAARYFLPDELTVQFKEEVGQEQAEAIIQEHRSRVVVQQRTPGYYTLAVPAGTGLFEAIREFSDLDDVEFAEPSEVSFNSALPYIPDDAEFGRLWGLHNTAQNVNGTAGTADADIDATGAWDVTRGHPNVIVAVIDTGADLDHPDLQPNLLPRGTEDWDFADLNDPVPDDQDGHGTHVAGTVVGTDNTAGVIGVAPGCRVMPLRVNLQTGMNQNRADAINYVGTQAVANPARRYVINCSWRMNGDHAGVRTAIQNTVNRNVVIVFAAGNANTNTDITPQFPGVYPEVVSVAALDQRDRKASFSNFGTNVDVAAPGVNIWSTMPNDTFGFLDGTSMASPHAAGVAALIWSRHQHLSNAQVREVLEGTCDNVDALNTGFAGMLGRGRINAFSAVTRPQFVVPNFGYSGGGWRVEKHPRFLADITGDGRADIVGFGDAGVWVSLNNGNGTFQAPQKVIDNFAYVAGGWRVEKHPRFLADITGDGRADIVGFGDAGVWVSLNNGNGTFQ